MVDAPGNRSDVGKLADPGLYLGGWNENGAPIWNESNTTNVRTFGDKKNGAAGACAEISKEGEGHPLFRKGKAPNRSRNQSLTFNAAMYSEIDHG